MSTADRQPRVSVVIPCRNDAATLPRVLEALGRQTYDRQKTEILVVDNGSADDSLHIARTFPVRLLEEPVPSAYLARNRGIAAATGDYVLFLDADTIPEPAWIERLVAAAVESDSWLAGGRIESVVAKPTLGSALLATSRSAEKRREMVEKLGRLSGGNMLVARAAFDKYGLFRPLQSGGDGEFSERANPGHRPIPYVESAVVVHQCDIGNWDYLRRAYRVGKGQAQTAGLGAAKSLSIPWRPGVGRVREIHQALRPLIKTFRFAVWAMLWLERWSFYFGYRAGLRAGRGT